MGQVIFIIKVKYFQINRKKLIFNQLTFLRKGSDANLIKKCDINPELFLK